MATHRAKANVKILAHTLRAQSCWKRLYLTKVKHIHGKEVKSE